MAVTETQQQTERSLGEHEESWDSEHREHGHAPEAPEAPEGRNAREEPEEPEDPNARQESEEPGGSPAKAAEAEKSEKGKSAKGLAGGIGIFLMLGLYFVWIGNEMGSHAISGTFEMWAIFGAIFLGVLALLAGGAVSRKANGSDDDQPPRRLS